MGDTFLKAAFLTTLILGPAAAAEPAAILESARQIPVAYQVDVVVVGGGAGAVSAAVAAAKQGAKVFLAAPHPYLGDDMTATLRLWLEPGEEPSSPLAQRIFADKPGKIATARAASPNGLPFSYESNPKSSKRHKDTNPPSLLNNGKWGDSARQSVQYDGDVQITADLQKVEEITETRVVPYRRAGDFDVASVTVQTSDDKQTWKDIGQAKNDGTADGHTVWSATIGAKARYVRFIVKRPSGIDRILLGQIEILGPAQRAAAANSPLPLGDDHASMTPAGARTAKLTPPRPMHVKKVLDDALLESGVSFLYQCYATDILRDAAGHPCGIVMANRAGRQAVVAKVVIDATDRARVARMAGAAFRPYPAGVHEFRRVVIGGEVQRTPHAPREEEHHAERDEYIVTARTIDPPFIGPYPNRAHTPSGTFPIIEYTLKISMKDDSPGSWAAAEQRARDMTYHPVQQFTSDSLFEVPPDSMHGRKAADGSEQSVQVLPLEAFQPADVPQVYVLGGCADISRSQAEKLLRPLAIIDLGERIGRAAAEEAKKLSAPVGAICGAGVSPAGAAGTTAPQGGDIRETLTGVRPIQKLPTIPQPARSLPILGRYDVVVIGGGTSGAPAGIAAARQGARTLVVESLNGLGGVGTLGAISNYCSGNRVGFTATVEEGTRTWVIEQKMEWWRKTLRDSGADIWFGSIGCGAVVRDQQVVGAVVATPQGRGVVLARVVVDATGNADVAAAAGATCKFTDAGELAMQGTGLPPRQLGASYTNTDFTITDETDVVDVWHTLVYAKSKYPEAFDQGTLVDTRERRCIVGDFTQTILDQVNRRTYPDTVGQARGGKYDTHGYTVDPYLTIAHPETGKLIVDIPYRCLLAKGLEGVLVTGLGLSAHRDATPLIRMQADMQNLGYATGAAAAMVAKSGTLVRNIDIRELQKHLVKIGNLTPEVLKQQDSYPLSAEKIAAAVTGLTKGPEASAVLFTQPEQALPLLRKAYTDAREADKPAYALVLGMMGDATGLETLMAEVRGAAAWDTGWNYKGMGQFGNALSPLDAKIVALGRIRERRAVPVILEKLGMLSADDAFSHHRAVGLALESIGDPAAAQPLAELLAKPHMSGHVHPTVAVAVERETPGGTNSEQTRRDSIREILLARALLRCGDHQGQGRKTLEAYTHDLRGHLARHAQAVLQEK